MANRVTGTTSDLESGQGTNAATTNCTVAVSTTQAHGGTHSLRTTTTAGGAATWESGQVTGFTAGELCSFSAWVRSSTTTRSVTMIINWFTSGSAFISQTNPAGFLAATSNSAWTQITGIGTAPALAAHASIVLVTSGGAASEIHYTDDWFADLAPSFTVTMAAASGIDMSMSVGSPVVTVTTPTAILPTTGIDMTMAVGQPVLQEMMPIQLDTGIDMSAVIGEPTIPQGTIQDAGTITVVVNTGSITPAIGVGSITVTIGAVT